MKHFNLIALLLLIGIWLSGCATTPPKEATEEELYQNAQEAMLSYKYTDAIENFEQLESHYPFGKYATKAQLGLIAAYYKKNEPEMTIATAERFIRVNPQHEDVDYAYYMKGVARFDTHKSYLQRFLPINTALRDQTPVKQAFDDFSELVQRFPNSQYVKDAKKRMIYLKNHVAMSEFHIAEYYYKRGAYVATLQRTKNIIENYPKTPAVALALALQTKSYQALGVDDLAKTSFQVLEKSYPQLLVKPEKKLP